MSKINDSIKMKIQDISVNEIEVNGWNPNVQDDKTFQSLVDNIQEIGNVEPIMVVLDDKKNKFVIISGEHRFKALVGLGVTEVPCIVKDLNKDQQKAQTVKMNVLHGKLDPEKFLKLFNGLSDKHGETVARDMMAFHDEKEFRKIVKSVKKNLTPKMKNEFEKVEKDIKDVKSLTAVVNDLLSNYGSTRDLNFMTFTLGGKDAIWIKASKEVYNYITKMSEYCDESEIDINEILEPILEQWDKDNEQ